MANPEAGGGNISETSTSAASNLEGLSPLTLEIMERLKRGGGWVAASTLLERNSRVEEDHHHGYKGDLLSGEDLRR